MEISTKLKIELPYHPEIPPLGIYQKELTSGYFEEIPAFPMFFTALFTIAKTWKQTKCSSVDD